MYSQFDTACSQNMELTSVYLGTSGSTIFEYPAIHEVGKAVQNVPCFQILVDIKFRVKVPSWSRVLGLAYETSNPKFAPQTVILSE